MMRSTAYRSIALAGVLGLGLTACAPADSRDAPAEESAAAAATPTVPEGTSMTFTIDDSVSSDVVRAGDRFTATLSGAVSDVEGDVVLPAGTRSRWAVKEAVAEGEDADRALLAVELESIQVNGEWREVEATVTGTSLQDAMEGEAEGEESTTMVALGEEAESLIDEVKGEEPDTTSTTEEESDSAAMATTAADEDAGAVLALASANGPARIDAGARITVRLAEELEISSMDR